MIYLQTVFWLKVLLFSTNNSICTQSNGSKYCYVMPMIQLRCIVKKFKVMLLNTSENYSFICIQLIVYT